MENWLKQAIIEKSQLFMSEGEEPTPKMLSKSKRNRSFKVLPKR